MASEAVVYAIRSFESARDRFLKDIEPICHEDLDRVWGDGSRRAYDAIFEVGEMNRRRATLFRGEEVPPITGVFGRDWLRAPEGLREKAAATAFIESTAKELTEAAWDLAAERACETKVTEALHFAALHATYHDGQLNFIQMMKGDLAVHW